MCQYGIETGEAVYVLWSGLGLLVSFSTVSLLDEFWLDWPVFGFVYYLVN
jgi:hypothetical protein